MAQPPVQASARRREAEAAGHHGPAGGRATPLGRDVFQLGGERVLWAGVLGGVHGLAVRYGTAVGAAAAAGAAAAGGAAAAAAAAPAPAMFWA